MRRVSYLVLMTCVIGGCSFEYHCGGNKPAINVGEAEGNVTSSYAALGWNPTSVHCDSGVAPVVGGIFHCQMELDGKQTYGLTATITSCTDARCDFHLDFVDPRRINGDRLAQAVAKTIASAHPNAAVDCGEPAPQLPTEGTLSCKVTADGYAGTAVISFDDSLENVKNIQLNPP